MQNINILIIGLVFIFVKCYFCADCPKDEDVVRTNLDKFKGEWYVVAGTPITGKMGSCLHLHVDHVQGERAFFMNFTTTSYRNNARLSWTVYGEQSGIDLTSKWQLTGRTKKWGPLRHQMLSLEYDCCCAMITCAEDDSIIQEKAFAMIWSREKTLENSTLTELKNKIISYVNKDHILDVDNSCDGISI